MLQGKQQMSPQRGQRKVMGHPGAMAGVEKSGHGKVCTDFEIFVVRIGVKGNSR